MSSKRLSPGWSRHNAPRKSYSYRYVLGAAVGPAGTGLRAGAAIIDSRYRGRTASWTITFASGETWEATATFVEPRADNPLAYPDPVVPDFAAEAAAGAAAAAAVRPTPPPLPPPSVPVQSRETVERRSRVSPPPPVRARTQPGSRTSITESASDAALREFHRALLSGSGSFDPVVS